MTIENPNSVFGRLWPFSAPIRLSDVDAARRDVLAEADANKDGVVTMREARDRLIVSSKVLGDPKSKTFKAELERFILDKTGKALDVTDQAGTAVARVYYLQLNNVGNKLLTEEKDLKTILGKDPDKPKLDTVNLTAEFNTFGDADAATAAFVANVTAYFDGLIARGERLTGFIISGHSNGTDMLQETEDHEYFANLDPRAVLSELRASNPKYAALMDGCEKFAALACFHGGALNEWAELFPNATLAGTHAFAPLASSRASAAIYDAAATAHQTLEDGKGDAKLARANGEKVPYNADLRARGLNVVAPSAAEALAAAEAQFKIAKLGYDAIQIDLAKILASGRGTYNQAFLDRAYAVANTFYLASNDLWIAQGRPGGDAGEQAATLSRLEFERRDLFAIRKNTERPQV